MWKIGSAQKEVKSAWKIIQETSNVDTHNLHNRKATPQFAVIDCAFSYCGTTSPIGHA